MNSRYEHRSHCKGSLKCHLIFVTRFRHDVLCGRYADACKEILTDTASLNGWKISKIETDKNHVHILTEYPPVCSISCIVKELKQKSTHYMWLRYRSFLRRHYWYQDTLWSKGYFYCSVGEVSEETIRRYIQNQG